MPVGNNQTLSVVTGCPLNKLASNRRDPVLIPQIPVSTVCNIPILPAAALFTAPKAYNQSRNLLPQTTQPLPPAQLMPFNSTLPTPAPAPRPERAIRVLQHKSTLPENMQSTLAASNTPSAGDFYLRIQQVLEKKNQKRSLKKLTLCTQVKKMITGTLSKIRLTAPESDHSATDLSARTDILPIETSVAGSSQILSGNNVRQPAAFSHFYYTGVTASHPKNYKALEIKAQKFADFFPENESRIVARLCRDWKTMDFESVLVLYAILKETYQPADIESMAVDKIKFRCFVKEESLNLRKPELTNIKWEQEADKNIIIEDYHGAEIRRGINDQYYFAPAYKSGDEIKDGGIFFRVFLENAPGENADNNAGMVEVSCTLSNLLLNRAEIGRHIDSKYKNQVFVRLPTHVKIDCEILDRAVDDWGNDTARHGTTALSQHD